MVIAIPSTTSATSAVNPPPIELYSRIPPAPPTKIQLIYLPPQPLREEPPEEPREPPFRIKRHAPQVLPTSSQNEGTRTTIPTCAYNSVRPKEMKGTHTRSRSQDHRVVVSSTLEPQAHPESLAHPLWPRSTTLQETSPETEKSHARIHITSGNGTSPIISGS